MKRNTESKQNNRIQRLSVMEGYKCWISFHNLQAKNTFSTVLNRFSVQ